MKTLYPVSIWIMVAITVAIVVGLFSLGMLTQGLDSGLVVGALTLGGVVVGHLLTAANEMLAFRRQSDKDNKLLRLNKLEELYDVLGTIDHHYGEILIGIMETGVYNTDQMAPFPRARMLFTAYAPSLADRFEEIRTRADDIALTFIQLSEQWPNITEDDVNNVSRRRMHFGIRIEEIQQEIANLAHEQTN